MDFLVSQKAQAIYANDNNEFPVSPDVPLSDGVNELAGGAKFDNIDLLKETSFKFHVSKDSIPKSSLIILSIIS